MRIIIFGDSIVYGAWDSEGGRVDRLKREAHRAVAFSGGIKKIQIINSGIGGDTSTKILTRMEREIVARKSADWPFAFVFSFGVNDQRLLAGQIETPIDKFESNVREIVRLAKQYSERIIFTSILPLAREEVIFKEYQYSNQRIVEYNARLQDVLSSVGVPFVTLGQAFLNNTEPGELYFSDGIHPNDCGHGLLAKYIQGELSALGWIL